VKFLIDECISARVVPLLAEAGHDVVHVEERGLAGHVDHEALELARSEGRILVSADIGFGEILASSGASLPSLVLPRQGNRSPQHRAAILLANLDEVAGDLIAGAVVVLTDDSKAHLRNERARGSNPLSSTTGNTPSLACTRHLLRALGCPAKASRVVALATVDDVLATRFGARPGPR
jgi:predicted nuclease of predicted toxin-antitoxin system